MFALVGVQEAELQRLAGLALSPVVAAEQATAWVEGVLSGSGLRLLQQEGLWRAMDAWLVELSPEAFVTLLPLLRRAFSGFQAPERRAMGEKVVRLYHAPAPGGDPAAGGGNETQLAAIDLKRASMVVPVLTRILGAGLGGEA